MGDRFVLVVDDDPATLADLVRAVPRSLRVLTARSLEDAVAGMEGIDALDAVVVAAGFREGAAVVREARVLHPAARRMVIAPTAPDRSGRAAWALRSLGRARRRRRL